MDPARLAEFLWQPWLVYLVLGVGLLVTLGTVFVQLRTLPRSIRGARARAPGEPPWGLLLAGSAGMGAISGAALAVTMGGPGALVWMWITAFLGMAIHWAEVTLARDGDRDTADERPYMARHLGGLGKALGAVFAVGLIAAAIAAGGLFQTHEAGVLLGTVLDVSPIAAGVVLAIAAVPFALMASARRVLVGVLVPATIALYTLMALVVVFEDPLALQLAVGDAINAAFGLGPAASGAAGGAMALALYHGVVRATFAGESGLGSAAAAGLQGGDRPAAAMLVPVVTTGLVATLTALAVMTRPASEAPVTDPELVPLERHESRGLRPSAQVGQTIVLPLDSELEEGKNYPMRLRANPRGHRFAKLMRERNVVVLPNWAIAEQTDTVVFRSRDRRFAEQWGWDVRVPMTRNVVETPEGEGFLELAPADPEIDLAKLITHYELDAQPYVVLGDYTFVGRVGRATSPDPSLGEHLAMYEPAAEDRPSNPKLHEFFRGGYRGPYADSAQERPPWAFVARDDVQPDLNEVVDLRLRADPRGEAFVRLDRAGGPEGPPWDFLTKVDTLIVRNDDDPSADIRIPVTPELDGFRIRFRSDDPQWQDFRRIQTMEGHSGPYALVPDFDFQAEVHGDARLASDLKGRRTFVPLHPDSEPIGPADTVPYRPHPGELVAAGMDGPFFAREGAEIVAARFEGAGGTWHTWVIALAGFVLAVSTIAAWAEYGARGAQQLLGAWAHAPTKIAVVLAAACGGLFSLRQVLGLADASVAIVAIPNLIAIGLCLPQLREALRKPAGPTRESAQDQEAT